MIGQIGSSIGIAVLVGVASSGESDGGFYAAAFAGALFAVAALTVALLRIDPASGFAVRSDEGTSAIPRPST